MMISKIRLKKASKLGRSAVSKMLGHNYYKLLKLYEFYGLNMDRKWGNQFGEFKPGNHIITNVEWINEKVDVYDLEVEDCHNFIANEICVHNSSQDPNFQNIPIRDKDMGRICRGVLYPRYGHQLLESDFKAIEVGISACYNLDPTLIKYVSDPTTDMHGDMAKQIFKMDYLDEKIPSHNTLRAAAKNGFVFPQFYGDYFKNNADSLAREWGGLSKGKWGTHTGIDLIGWEPKFANFHLSDHLKSKGITEFGTEEKVNGKWVQTGFLKHLKEIEDDFWNNRFAVYKQWKDDWYAEYVRNGYINLYTGFTCRGPMDKKQVCNYPVQGAAFHCLLRCFIEIDRISWMEKWDSKLIGQIHDSMILDVHPDELTHVAKTIHHVTSVWLPKQFPWIIVPVRVSMELTPVDASWAEKDKYKVEV